MWEGGPEARDWDWENQPFTTMIARPTHSDQGGGRRYGHLMRVYPQFVDFLWKAIKATGRTDLAWNAGSYEKVLEVVLLLLEAEVVQK